MENEFYEEIPVKTGGDFKTVSTGAHPAVCIGVIRLGMQMSEFQGEKKFADKVLLRWEIHSEGEVTDKGEPLVIGKRYTFSFHEKSALFKHVKAWQGVDAVANSKFNIFKLLGQSCLLIVAEDKKGDKVYANVDSVMPYKGGALKPFNPLVAFSLQPASYNQETFDKLPEWVRDIVILSPEFRQLHDQGVATPHKDLPKPAAKPSHDDGLPEYLND